MPILIIRTVLLYGTLALVGGWLWLLLRRWAPEVWRPPAALLGIIVVQLVGWYWSAQADRGLFTLWPVLFVGGCAASAVLAWRDRVSLRQAIRSTGAWATEAVAVSLSLVLFAVVWRTLLSQAILSIAAINNDIAAYAMAARHVSHAGFSSAGPIAGYDLGNLARNDVYGALNLFSLAQWVTRREAFEIALPVLAVICALLAQTVVALLRLTTRLHPAVICLLAVLPQSTFLFTYIMTCYFGGQLLGLAMAMAATVAIFGHAKLPSPRGRLANGASLVAMFFGLMMTYPHMLFLFTPIVVLVALFSARGNAERVGLLVTVGSAMACTALLGPERFLLAIDRTLFLGQVQAGWPLPGVLPVALIGVQSSWSHTVSAGTVVASVLVVGGACTAGWSLVRNRQTGWSLPAAPIVIIGLATYGAVYFLRGGPVYTQWKWISFLQPVLCVALIAPLTGYALTRWARPIAVPFVAGALAILIGANTVSADHQRRAVHDSRNWVSIALGRMGQAPELADVRSVNIDLGPYWESMWAADALAPRTVYLLKPTYYGVTAPKAPWTLIHREDVPTGLSPGAVRLLDGGYALVRSGTS